MNHPLIQLIVSRLREFYREPEALFWVYGFPLLLAIGLGIAFSSKEPEPSVVDVQAGPDRTTAEQIAEQLKAAGLVVEVLDEAACRQRFRTGKTALFVVPDGDSIRFVYDKTRPESFLARSQVETALLRWKAGAAGAWEPEVVSVTEKGSRYIDFLIPGLIGLNLMGGGLWGVGFVLVDMRVRKLLKRLLATPMRRSHFLLSILGSRLVLMLPDMAVLVLVGCFGFGVPVRGDVMTLALVILAGGAAFAGIGLLIACRTEKTETVSGLMNLVMLPMWLLSGTFFSSKRFPEVAQPFIQALPLTQLNDALREVMLEGAGLYQVGWRIGIGIVGVDHVCVALRWFRWQ